MESLFVRLRRALAGGIDDIALEMVVALVRSHDGAKGGRPRNGLSPAKRFRVLKRDGFRCVYCGTTGTASELTVDHIVPVSGGGSDDDKNLVACCNKCNLGKGVSNLETGSTPPVSAGGVGGGLSSGSVRSGSESGSLLSLSDPEKVNTMGRRRRGVETYSSQFLEFWAAYPRKVGKGAAWKAWRLIALEDTPPLYGMTAALAWQRLRPEWTKDGGAFVPHPATWLNQRRWEDEPPTRGNGAPPPPLTKPRLPEFRECLPENLPQLPEWAK